MGLSWILHPQIPYHIREYSLAHNEEVLELGIKDGIRELSIKDGIRELSIKDGIRELGVNDNDNDGELVL